MRALRLLSAPLLGLTLGLILAALPARAAQMLVPMDLAQLNHLKAYGVAYHALAQGQKIEWLLNYRGGSFLLPDDEGLRREAARRGVLYEDLEAGEVDRLRKTIEGSDME